MPNNNGTKEWTLKKPLKADTKRKFGPETLSRAQRLQYDGLFAQLRGTLWEELDNMEPGATARRKAFAEESGLSMSTIQNILNGAIENPQFLTVFKLSIALGYVEELIAVFQKTNNPMSRTEAKRLVAAKKRSVSRKR